MMCFLSSKMNECHESAQCSEEKKTCASEIFDLPTII